jgi:LmbE family N-acetylglucosaminyl deacetylase
MGLDHVVFSRRQVLRLGSWVGAAAVPRFGIAAASRPGDREVIFYSPHPDDETLTLGVLVASHVLAGRKVHVVLFTDGRDSRAFPVVNARLKAEHRAPLTRAQFGAARVRECRAACAALGVPSANVHFEALTAVAVANATAVIRSYQRRFPDAGHYTISWTDTFAAHGNLGEALRRLRRADPKTYFDTRWGVSRLHWGEPALRACRPWSSTSTAAARARVGAAVASYDVWSPAHGRYRISYTSVAPQFRALKADVRSMLHGPPP